MIPLHNNRSVGAMSRWLVSTEQKSACQQVSTVVHPISKPSPSHHRIFFWVGFKPSPHGSCLWQPGRVPHYLMKPRPRNHPDSCQLATTWSARSVPCAMPMSNTVAASWLSILYPHHMMPCWCHVDIWCEAIFCASFWWMSRPCRKTPHVQDAFHFWSDLVELDAAPSQFQMEP